MQDNTTGFLVGSKNCSPPHCTIAMQGDFHLGYVKVLFCKELRPSHSMYKWCGEVAQRPRHTTYTYYARGEAPCKRELLHIPDENHLASLWYNVVESNSWSQPKNLWYCLAFKEGFWYNKSIEWGYALSRRSVCHFMAYLPECIVSYTVLSVAQPMVADQIFAL